MQKDTAQIGRVGIPTPSTLANKDVNLKAGNVGSPTVYAQSTRPGIDKYPSAIGENVWIAARNGALPGYLTAQMLSMLERAAAVAAGTQVIQNLFLNVGIEENSGDGETSLNACSLGQLQAFVAEANGLLSDALQSLSDDLNEAVPQGGQQ